ncbi:hypothetical protein [Runella sp.]|uniref:hypothetical protein n=1 Tax=Runella sp. TaxID=1960881 RepID=UPI003D0EC30A
MTPTHWIYFDTSPTIWWLLCHLALGIVSFQLIRRQQPFSDWLFLVVIGVVTGLMRFPAFVYNLPLNPDESQLLAQGLTLAYDPIFYRSVDPTTSGPINSSLLTFLYFLGVKLDFRLAHFLSWVLTFISLTLIYKSLKRLQLGVNAQLALLPAAAFVSFVQDEDYLHYYSESIAIVFLSLNVYLMSRWDQRKKVLFGELIVFGVSTALIVLCKIQAIPLAFVLGAGSLYFIYAYHKPKFFVYAAVLTLGVIGVWGVWLAHLWSYGMLEDFYFYYIKANALLKRNFGADAPKPAITLWVTFPLIVYTLGKGLEYFFLPFILSGLGYLFYLFSKKTFWKTLSSKHYFWVLVGIYFVAVIATVIRTGSFYPHHFLFFIVPCCLLMGFFLRRLPSQWGWLIMITQGVYFFYFAVGTVTRTGINKYPTNFSDEAEFSPVSREILKYAKPGEYLVVWGWDCQYYVETQMPQGVNENHSVRSAMEHSLQKTYYQRYVRDIMRTKPAVFVDAMTKTTLWMDDPDKYGHQNYPELAHYIATHYALKATINGVRVYARIKT